MELRFALTGVLLLVAKLSLIPSCAVDVAAFACAAPAIFAGGKNGVRYLDVYCPYFIAGLIAFLFMCATAKHGGAGA